MTSAPASGSPPPAFSPRTRHIVYNLLGQAVPLMAGLVTVPALLAGLGVERMGILAIAWLIVGYSGLLDLGLSRSITQITAAQLGAGKARANRPVLWTALAGTGALSLGATLALVALARPVAHLIGVSPGLRDETIAALRLFALSLPPAILASILIGFLTAYARFGLINALKIPTGLLLTAGPLLSVAFGSRSLVPVMIVLTGARWLSLLGFAWAAGRVEPGVWREPQFQPRCLRALLGLGSWITVTNVVSPLLVYCDRFLIGWLCSAAFVAYYTTPQDVVTRILVLPVAMGGVLFPTIARDYSRDPRSCLAAAHAMLVRIFVLLFPLVAGVVVFAEPAMRRWVGGDFTARSYPLLQIFAVGVLLNAVAQIPATVLQAIGQPRRAALLHLLELALYVPSAYFAVRHFGLLGAALTWAARIAFDLLGLNRSLQRACAGFPPLLDGRELTRQGSLVAALILYIALCPDSPHPLGLLLPIVFFVLYHREIIGLLSDARHHLSSGRRASS